MELHEGKKIVIRIPKFYWKSLLSVRFGAVLLILFSVAGFSYWYTAMRPFLWVADARVDSFSAVVSSDFAGKIAELGPQEGESVQKGKLLFALDSGLLAEKRKEAEESVAFLNAEIESEKKRMEKAMGDYLALSDAETGFETIAQHLDVLEKAQKKSEEAESQLALARKKCSLVDLEIKKMAAAAPFNGVVLKRAKNLGEAVAFGEPVYLLSDPARTWIEAEIPEKELSRIAVGTAARVRVLAYPKKEWEGRVFWIGPATASKIGSRPFSRQNETIAVKISLENLDIPLKPGLSAEVGLKIY